MHLSNMLAEAEEEASTLLAQQEAAGYAIPDQPLPASRRAARVEGVPLSPRTVAKGLMKARLTELSSMNKPPASVRLVMEAVCEPPSPPIAATNCVPCQCTQLT